MGCSIYQVDAFTSELFTGNPAAVCLSDRKRPDEWMQALAAEMNLSETAFVAQRNEPNEFDLRWFTPTVEVDLCGHATLAAAHVLWEEKRVSSDQMIHFHTRSGLLKVAKRGGLIELDFPLDPVSEITPPPEIAAALGLCAVYVGRGRDDYLIVVETEQMVRELSPDFLQLAKIPARGFCVTAPGEEEGIDFISRFFAPRAGIDEDPVTGSAHCMLAPYWAARLGKQYFTARQRSPRGGVVTVEVKGERVALSGQAVMVWKGQLTSPV
ncbi:Phenazine biosynthesis protein PhzF like [hydrothermal vent metagenome]|uniref:Phenazine biosynthesis protein PhzF like n=1 Tax=hydrothermal vent metagenome TaxID=652676 RepID=A0A3B1A3B3_9ZZZZ